MIAASFGLKGIVAIAIYLGAKGRGLPLKPSLIVLHILLAMPFSFDHHSCCHDFFLLFFLQNVD
jgi:hypothetical protein